MLYGHSAMIFPGNARTTILPYRTCVAKRGMESNDYFDTAEPEEALPTLEDKSRGARSLWLEVLSRGIMDASGNVGRNDGKQRNQIQQEAMAWLNDDDDHTGSIGWIIRATGLRATKEAIRGAVASHGRISITTKLSGSARRLKHNEANRISQARCRARKKARMV